MIRILLISVVILFVACGNEVPEVETEIDTPIEDTVEVEKPMEFDFRKTNWEMTMDEIIKIEGIPDVNKKNILMYGSKDVGGKSTIIIYLFHAKKLIKGFYLFGYNNTIKPQFITDFDEVYEMLNAKYDEPTESNNDWTDEETKIEFEGRYGFAVAQCHLTRTRIWNREKTTISQILVGTRCAEIDLAAKNSKSQIQHIVKYASTDIDRIIKENSDVEVHSNDF